MKNTKAHQPSYRRREMCIDRCCQSKMKKVVKLFSARTKIQGSGHTTSGQYPQHDILVRIFGKDSFVQALLHRFTVGNVQLHTLLLDMRHWQVLKKKPTKSVKIKSVLCSQRFYCSHEVFFRRSNIISIVM